MFLHIPGFCLDCWWSVSGLFLIVPALLWDGLGCSLHSRSLNRLRNHLCFPVRTQSGLQAWLVVQSGPKLDSGAFFLKCFSRGSWLAFSTFFLRFEVPWEVFFLIQCWRNCGLLSKSDDPRFLHTVQRFGLISKVLGLPKSRKTLNKVS